ncbi:MAG: CPXCG motif-containing cysteine-rich protein [Bacteroidota bacterium]
MYEHFFQCPYCWEEISMLLDTSVSQQTYIEDCEVCCNPIEVTPRFLDNELQGLDVRNIGQ